MSLPHADELVAITREGYDVPSRLVVRSVERSGRWDHARCTSTPGVPPRGATVAEPEELVLRRRSGRRWREPRPGEELEVLVWADPGGPAFHEPDRGARLFALVRGSLDDHVDRWRSSGRAW